MQFREASVAREGSTFRVAVAVLDNAVITFCNEGSERMGTLALAMPGMGEMRASTSSVVAGAKFMIASRALAERIAARTAKMSLVSLYSTLDDQEAFRIYSKLFDDALASKPER